jgi:hypothetical protein
MSSSAPTTLCYVCDKPTTLRCKTCASVYYCSPACQKKDWKWHKFNCFKRGCPVGCPCASPGFEFAFGADGEYLLKLMNDCKVEDSERAVFLRVGLDTKCEPVPEVVAIGKRAFEKGGDDGMQALGQFVQAYARCRALHHGQWWIKSDSRELESAWDGIGGWKA